MNELDFLKKQHLSMFGQKRKIHKQLVETLYRQYISDNSDEQPNKWSLFSNFYLYFSKHFPAEIYENEYIVGTNWHWRWQAEIKEIPVPHNSGHFIADFRDFLEKGICGKISEVDKIPDKTA